MASQFQEDIDYLRECQDDGVALFCDLWSDTGCSCIALHRDEVVRECFIALDVSILRGHFWHSKGSLQDIDLEQIEKPHVCGLKKADGSTCSQRFDTKPALSFHQRQARGGEHGLCSPLYTGVVANQCPWCGSTFSSRHTAVRHVQLAYTSGHCCVVKFA